MFTGLQISQAVSSQTQAALDQIKSSLLCVPSKPKPAWLDLVTPPTPKQKQKQQQRQQQQRLVFRLPTVGRDTIDDLLDSLNQTPDTDDSDLSSECQEWMREQCLAVTARLGLVPQPPD